MLANEVDAARRILLERRNWQRDQPLCAINRTGRFRAATSNADSPADRCEPTKRPPRPTFHAQVLNARGAMLVRLDRLDEAQRSYDEVIALVDDGRHPTELGVALSGRAVTDAMSQEFGRALDGFARARVQLEAAGDALAVARVDANVGTLEVDRGRPAAGMPFLDGAIESFAAMAGERAGDGAPRANARVPALLKPDPPRDSAATGRLIRAARRGTRRRELRARRMMTRAAVGVGASACSRKPHALPAEEAA